MNIIEQDSVTFRPRRGALDIGKAKRLLGFDPRYRLEDGLREYVAFARGEGARLYAENNVTISRPAGR